MPAQTESPDRDTTAGDTLRKLGGTILAVFSAIVIAISITGGSYALWTDGKTATGGTIAAGNASLTITQSLNVSLWNNLTPGESVRQAFTVTNAGSVPMSLAGSATRANASVEIRLASGACPATALTSTQATASPTALGTVAIGATMTVCLEVTLAAAAAPGATSTLGVTIDGTQV